MRSLAGRHTDMQREREGEGEREREREREGEGESERGREEERPAGNKPAKGLECREVIGVHDA